MTTRERFRRTLNFEPVDRLPIIEWAGWWDKTVARWRDEGLPADLPTAEATRDYFGQDAHRQYWIPARGPGCPGPAGHGLPVVNNRDEYRAIKQYLYPDPAFDANVVRGWAEQQAKGERAVWVTLDGFFWYARGLLGIEQHLLSFYDQPDLMTEINEDLTRFLIRVMDQFCEVCVPDWLTIAEDMSYNHGPMLSKDQFDEFMGPYYRRIIPRLVERGIVPFVDTDGDVTLPASWFEEVGVQGLLPLERMAGVDIVQLRRDHPKLRMLGAYDKTVMHLGEARMRQEFERIFPVMCQGGYIPSCDHQTPPGVSLEDYRLWLRLLREY
jgi:hypothetical protein